VHFHDNLTGIVDGHGSIGRTLLPKTLLSTFALRLAALGIAEPSALLAEAIGFIGQAVRAATPRRRSDLRCITHPGPSQSAGRTGLGRLAGQMLRLTLGARRATPLAGKQTKLRPHLANGHQ
jgi:hypothetical protein